MKKALMLMFTLSILLLMPVSVNAYDWHKGRYDNDDNWHRTHYNDYRSERELPFRWHENYDRMRQHHRLHRIHDRELEDRFSGLHAYRWHSDEGFWHHGHYVNNAICFFDENDELVSVGYMVNGVFVYFREDHKSYETQEKFFLLWWVTAILAE